MECKGNCKSIYLFKLFVFCEKKNSEIVDTHLKVKNTYLDILKMNICYFTFFTKKNFNI